MSRSPKDTWPSRSTSSYSMKYPAPAGAPPHRTSPDLFDRLRSPASLRTSRIPAGTYSMNTLYIMCSVILIYKVYNRFGDNKIISVDVRQTSLTLVGLQQSYSYCMYLKVDSINIVVGVRGVQSNFVDVQRISIQYAYLRMTSADFSELLQRTHSYCMNEFPHYKT